MARRTDPSAATVKAVRKRDRESCARCGTGWELTTHHRRNRGMGGSRWEGINCPSNLLTLCGSGTTGCHGWVTDNPAAARELGLVVSYYANPSTTPVRTYWDGWVLLLAGGDVELLPDYQPA